MLRTRAVGEVILAAERVLVGESRGWNLVLFVSGVRRVE